MSEAGAKADAITSFEFTELMRMFEPFEPAANVAVACSGGPDSMALLVLAQGWIKSVGGKLTALIVDHRLRDESTEEANAVAQRLKALDVEAVVLTWSGARPSANLQEKAREARYRLLFGWCAANAVLHLLAAHHKDDQAETVLLRLDRGSGDDGLAGMAVLQEFASLRLLRPLLSVAKNRLQATADAWALKTEADPSNDDLRFDRVRIRRRIKNSNSSTFWYKVGAKASKRRASRDDVMARHLAANCEIYPEGYSRLQSGFWRCTSDEIAMRALSAIIGAVGGRSHPLRRRKIRELYRKLEDDRLSGGATSGGCRIVPEPNGSVLVIREIGLVHKSAAACGRIKWDGRFDIDIRWENLDYKIQTLGSFGLRSILKDHSDIELNHIPMRVLETLPAVWGLEGVIEVPHLNYSKGVLNGNEKIVHNICFAPICPIQATRFTI